MEYKFENREEYLEWCAGVIGKIYYANISMNGEMIRHYIDEIATTMWCAEGQDLY